MEITIQLPDDIVEFVRQKQPDLARLALEAMAITCYNRKLIGQAQVGELLGFDSRFEVEEFLHRNGAALAYDLGDYERDLETLARTAQQ